MFTCAICGGSGSSEAMGPNLYAYYESPSLPDGSGAWYHITCWAMSPDTGQGFESGFSSHRGSKPPTEQGPPLHRVPRAGSRVQQVMAGQRTRPSVWDVLRRGATKSGHAGKGRRILV